MAIKLDMEKACDWLDGILLKKMFSKLTFFELMDQLDLAIYDNDYIQSYCQWKNETRFVQERHIRQGDPLSFYISIIYLEYLRKCFHFIASKKISGFGIRLNKDTLKIACLMFVGDYIIFCRTNKSVAQNIKQILDHY